MRIVKSQVKILKKLEKGRCGPEWALRPGGTFLALRAVLRHCLF